MILYTKPRKYAGSGKTDNITYLMQNTDKGKKRKTQAEMQAIADEKNRQMGILGVNTKTEIWPEGKPFNRDFLDPTDNVVSVGDRGAQESWVTQNFPEQGGSAVGWGTRGIGEVGKAKPIKTIQLSGAPNITTPGQWGVVDRSATQNFTKEVGSQGKLSSNQLIAYLLGHESGHNFFTMGKRDDHASGGIMASGEQNLANMQGGEFVREDGTIETRAPMSVDQMLEPKRNPVYIQQIIKNRQYGDPNRQASDNYDINKAKFEAIQAAELEKKRLTGLPGFHKKQETIPGTELFNY